MSSVGLVIAAVGVLADASIAKRSATIFPSPETSAGASTMAAPTGWPGTSRLRCLVVGNPRVLQTSIKEGHRPGRPLASMRLSAPLWPVDLKVARHGQCHDAGQGSKFW